MDFSRPKLRKFQNGDLVLMCTAAAASVKAKNKFVDHGVCLPPEVMHSQAVQKVEDGGGDPANRMDCLSEYRLQFGAYQGQSFRWILENDMGYSAYLVDSLRYEKVTPVPLSSNKMAFKVIIATLKFVYDKEK